MDISLDQLNAAFQKAEQDTAEMFDGQTCSMTDIHGEDTCPICFFRMQAKKYLGIENAAESDPPTLPGE